MNTFSLSRISLLYKRYFVEHWRRDLITLAVFAIPFIFITHIIKDTEISLILFSILFICGGLFYASRIFGEIHPVGSGMHYMHIPASRLEKYFVNWSLSLILLPLACVGIYILGNLLGNAIVPLMPKFLNFHSISFSTLALSKVAKNIFPAYVVAHSAFLFSSLCFKKSPFFKTILWCIIIAVGLILVQSLYQELFLNDIIHNQPELMSQKMSQLLIKFMNANHSWIKYAQHGLNALFTLFFWTLAYLKLKEKQV